MTDLKKEVKDRDGAAEIVNYLKFISENSWFEDSEPLRAAALRGGAQYNLQNPGTTLVEGWQYAKPVLLFASVWAFYNPWGINESGQFTTEVLDFVQAYLKDNPGATRADALVAAETALKPTDTKEK